MKARHNSPIANVSLPATMPSGIGMSGTEGIGILAPHLFGTVGKFHAQLPSILNHQSSESMSWNVTPSPACATAFSTPS